MILEKTLWNLTTMEMQAKLKAMPGMNASVFKKWFYWYNKKIIAAMTDVHKADNLKTAFTENFEFILRRDRVKDQNQNIGDKIMTMPFKREMADDLLDIYHNIIRMQQKEQRKKEIVAASKGLDI